METKSVFRAALAASFMLAFGASPALYAQDENNAPDDEEANETLEELIVTGTRIRAPNLVSPSPVNSIGAEEIEVQQNPEIEKILRVSPVNAPGDGQNVNNGTAGIATVDPRGLGDERTVVLMDGLRLTPANWEGKVDVSQVPTSLIERVDILTGGASTVYGSDAISGAVNFIMKKDFEGVEFSYSIGELFDSKIDVDDDDFDGQTQSVSLTMGSNLADDRGNIVLNLAYSERNPLLLGALDIGQLGINTAPDDADVPLDQQQNAGLASFLSGAGAVEPSDPGCAGPSAADFLLGSGSTTAIPTRVEIVGGGTFGQFRNDGTIGSQCSRFNFNPFNYFQTPQEKYSAIALGTFEVNEDMEVYSRLSFSHITVQQQVAPSGTFGQSFWVPISNPLIGDQARDAITAEANRLAADGTLTTSGAAANWRDVNGNNRFDSGDYLNMLLRRRTIELGFRDETYESEYFHTATGIRGNLPFGNDLTYDVSFQYGQSNRNTRRAGYTNLTNIQNALDVSGTSRDDAVCNNGDSTCVPLDLFGGFGTITPEMAAYATAVALQEQKYDQSIFTASMGGQIEAIQLPTAGNPLAFNIGFERRSEDGSLEPDECLKLAPSSCQGGAGGNLLPIAGGISVKEIFGEAILPVFEDAAFADSFNLELGFRTSDYDLVGRHDTWKAGFVWSPNDQLLFRAMRQQAIRAANVDELFAPVVTGLDNAQLDPCSVANAGNIDATLMQLCMSTGMSAAQVGRVDDVISAQVNTFEGADPNAPASPETADTLTLGVVWTPTYDIGPISNLSLSLDYYDIDIEDIIGEFSAQEILDGCYKSGRASDCAKINRVAGSLTLSGAGVNLLTTNLNYLQAEGLEANYGFDIGLNEWGNLRFSGTVNKFLTHESQSSDDSSVVDCKGFIATDCDGVFDLRWTARTTWEYDTQKDNRLSVSLLWRHNGSLEVPERERNLVFREFREIPSYDFFDLFVGYELTEANMKFGVGIENITDEDPPIVGQDIGDTSYNFGNTLPSHYDIFGRVLRASFKYTF